MWAAPVRRGTEVLWLLRPGGTVVSRSGVLGVLAPGMCRAQERTVRALVPAGGLHGVSRGPAGPFDEGRDFGECQFLVRRRQVCRSTPGTQDSAGQRQDRMVHLRHARQAQHSSNAVIVATVLHATTPASSPCSFQIPATIAVPTTSAANARTRRSSCGRHGRVTKECWPSRRVSHGHHLTVHPCVYSGGAPGAAPVSASARVVPVDRVGAAATSPPAPTARGRRTVRGHRSGPGRERPTGRTST